MANGWAKLTLSDSLSGGHKNRGGVMELMSTLNLLALLLSSGLVVWLLIQDII